MIQTLLNNEEKLKADLLKEVKMLEEKFSFLISSFHS